MKTKKIRPYFLVSCMMPFVFMLGIQFAFWGSSGMYVIDIVGGVIALFGIFAAGPVGVVFAIISIKKEKAGNLHYFASVVLIVINTIVTFPVFWFLCRMHLI